MTDINNTQTLAENKVDYEFSKEDIKKNKTMAGLAYLIFFLPLIACPDSPFARFHANQGLILAIMGFVGSIVLMIIPFLGWVLLPFYSIFVLVVAIIGMMNGLNGKAKEIPIIGKYRILK